MMRNALFCRTVDHGLYRLFLQSVPAYKLNQSLKSCSKLKFKRGLPSELVQW